MPWVMPGNRLLRLSDLVFWLSNDLAPLSKEPPAANSIKFEPELIDIAGDLAHDLSIRILD